MSTHIFSSDNDESAVQVIRSTMSVSTDEKGNSVVSFATGRGKGTGAQTIPVAEFRSAVECLQGFVSSGFETENFEPSVADTIRSTISCKDGIVSFRVRSGKGAKPAKIPQSLFGEVVSLLSSIVPAVEAAGASVYSSEDSLEDSSEDSFEDSFED